MRQRFPPTRRNHPAPNSVVGVLVERLNQLARERGPGSKLPTVQEIRQEYGVSVTTVQEALHALEATHVLFRRQGSGIFVSPYLHRKNIRVLLNGALACGEGVSPFWGMLWGRCTEAAQTRALSQDEALHFHLVAPNAGLDAEYFAALESDVLTGRVHGILSIGLDDTVSPWMRRPEIPHVAYAGDSHWRVWSGDDSLIRVGINALAAQGCKRIGYWNHVVAHAPAGVAALEKETFEDVLKALDLPVTPFALAHQRESADPEWAHLTIQEQGYRLAHRVFSAEASPFDGLFLGDDMMTSGVLVAFQELGVRIGKDIMLATGANAGSPILFGYENRLIRIEADPGAIVRAMFGLLDELMAGRPPQTPIVTVAPTLRIPANRL